MFNVLVDAVDSLISMLLNQVPQRENLWTEQCIGPQLTRLGQLNDYLPTANSLTAFLKDLTVEQRVTAIRNRREVVWQTRQDLMSELRGTGSDISVLDRVRKDAQNFVYEGELFPDPQTHVPRRAVTDPGRLLRVDETTTSQPGHPEELQTVTATRLFDPRALEPGEFAEHEAQSEAGAANLLVQLRCLNDVYARLRVACTVKGATLAAFSRILALWRTEGDLAVPPSMPSLKGKDTAAVEGHLILWPPGRLQQAFTLTSAPHLFTTVQIVHKYRLVNWLVRFQAQVERPCEPLPGLQFEGDHAILHAGARLNRLQLADGRYHLFLMGLDVFYVNKMMWRKKNGQVCSTGELRTMVRGVNDEIAFGLRWNSLDESEIPIKNAWIVAPKEEKDDSGEDLYSPVKYVGEIVKDGVYLLEWIRRQRRVPFVDSDPLGPGPLLPDALAYSAYHLGLHRVPALWASAMSYASRRRTEQGRKLDDKVRKRMKEAGITRAEFDQMAGAVRRAQQEAVYPEALRSWETVLSPILQSAGVLDALNQYLIHASLDEWPSWAAEIGGNVRENIVRYHNLRRFYADLFEEKE